ncbi:hypothetical protein GPECTOR_13g849 [Gonium pectorale]|uniref:3-hydroxyacyl-CoA dehydrogenase NAD binding domain-containing protein n=1 Tax=Gonium pectorale TaxID=33097 RepID=A0A150GPU4_GONPE|nr:hypothetical protein GPECTOR_13g849 [Gonium pectorale]|eukprot:KXZ51360.1 hypothetical protein GPECTOR_13g849 [Gonium pectorale]
MASMLYQQMPSVVGIVGAGQMGCGIAQVIAQRGLTVLLNDVSSSVVERGLSGLQKGLERLVRKGAVSPDDATATLGRIHASHGGLDALRGADFIIEAVAEDEALKKEVFKGLDRVSRVETILASNTSSISITRIASATTKPHRVVGMHFMHPAPVVPLVELAKGMHTSQQGFLVYRLLMPLINEAFFLLSEGVGSAEDIDRSMRLGTAMKAGPLRLADQIGLDTCLSIMRALHSQFGDSKYRPCPLLVQYVDGGLLGAKSGRGVFQHDPLIHDISHASQPHVNLTHHVTGSGSQPHHHHSYHT